MDSHINIYGIVKPLKIIMYIFFLVDHGFRDPQWFLIFVSLLKIFSQL